MVGIGKAAKGDVVGLPVSPYRLRILGGDCEYLRPSSDEQLVVLAQLRQVPAAERSTEAAIEHEDNILSAQILGKAYLAAISGDQGKVRCDGQASPLLEQSRMGLF